MITPLLCSDFLQQALPVVDVRSPGEFDKSHIPGAVNLPLLNDEHRHLVGICYKEQGKEAAIALGYSLVNPIREQILASALTTAPDKNIAVYCARGGLRSNKTAEYLSENGFNVFVLKGGYKAYRNLALRHISTFSNIMVLAGHTGCGKTEILKVLREQGEQVLDLEHLASHRGSAFGAMGMAPQPGNAQFTNLIYEALKAYDPAKRLWVESESVTIGKVTIPWELWSNIITANGIEIAIPDEQRINNIVNQYGGFDIALLQQNILRLERKLGGKDAHTLAEMLTENRMHEVVSRLLKYYDKAYNNSRLLKNCQNYVKFQFENSDPTMISRLLLQHLQK